MNGVHLRALEAVTRVRGLRGALLVAAADGIVVAESLMEGVDGHAMAALVASLAGRVRRVTAGAGLAAPSFLQLRAERGALLAMPAGPDLLLVALVDSDANLGLARLALMDAARVVA